MKIKELLTDESKWTQGVGARDLHLEHVSSKNQDAVCWCLLGAIERCYAFEQYLEVERKLADAIEPDWHKNEYISFCLIIRWNDAPERTFEDVKKLVEELDI